MDFRESGFQLSLRKFGAYACIGLLLLFVATLLYRIAAFVYFKVTGDLFADIKAHEMQWGEMGAFLLGSVVIAGLLAVGAFFLLPEFDGEREEPESPGTPPPAGQPSAMSRTQAPAAPPSRSPRSEAHEDRSRAKEQRREDAEVLKMVRSDPQLAAVQYFLERLLQDQEVRAHLKATEMEQRAKNRDYVMLGIGTVLGVVGPVVSAPLLRNVPF